MRRDPSRLVIAASGWNDFEVNLMNILDQWRIQFWSVINSIWWTWLISDEFQVGHFRDVHVYPGPVDADGRIVRWVYSATKSYQVLAGQPPELLWWERCGVRWAFLLQFFLNISQSLVPWGHCWNGDKEAGEHFAQHHVGGLARYDLKTPSHLIKWCSNGLFMFWSKAWG